MLHGKENSKEILHSVTTLTNEAPCRSKEGIELKLSYHRYKSKKSTYLSLQKATYNPFSKNRFWVKPVFSYRIRKYKNTSE
jgi:hypothetical protein